MKRRRESVIEGEEEKKKESVIEKEEEEKKPEVEVEDGSWGGEGGKRNEERLTINNEQQLCPNHRWCSRLGKCRHCLASILH